MDIKFNPSLIKLSSKLLVILKQTIRESPIDKDTTQITVNFRDSSYNTEAGGYHPVEISLQKDLSEGSWTVLYITDFCYYGHPYAELVKDLDFDFSLKMLFTVYSQPRPITQPSAKEVYRLWQYNFLSYLEYGAYDQIKVSAN
jgi:hypothetical protein